MTRSEASETAATPPVFTYEIYCYAEQATVRSGLTAARAREIIGGLQHVCPSCGIRGDYGAYVYREYDD